MKSNKKCPRFAWSNCFLEQREHACTYEPWIDCDHKSVDIPVFIRFSELFGNVRRLATRPRTRDRWHVAFERTTNGRNPSSRGRESYGGIMYRVSTRATAVLWNSMRIVFFFFFLNSRQKSTSESCVDVFPTFPYTRSRTNFVHSGNRFKAKWCIFFFLLW